MVYIVCMFVKDLARLFVWTLREYEEIDPIILSGQQIDVVLQ